MKFTQRLAAFVIMLIMVISVMPFSAMAVKSADKASVMPLATTGKTAITDVVKVKVTAINDSTGAEEVVPGATVRLFVGTTQKKTAVTDSNGIATISLSGLTIDEKHKATVSADKVVSRGKAIDGNARDNLYTKYYPNDGGGFYRYTMELHSETIDKNGNWVGEKLPKVSSSNKIDMVFAIDATGSMSDEINNVKENLGAFSKLLIDEGLDIRFCIIEYLDITTNEYTVVHEYAGSRWYSKIDAVENVLASIELGNGGDWPETPIDALGEIADSSAMKYRSDAHKFAFVLTDAGYKNDNTHGYKDMDDVTNALEKLGIVTSVITTSSYKREYTNLIEQTKGIYADIYASDFKSEMLNLSASIIDAVTREMTLTLSEPRLLVNMSACYFADDKTSKSSDYKNNVKKMLNEYAHQLAETSDGHVMIDKMLLLTTNNRMDFYDTSTDASKCDIRIETEEKDDGKWLSNVQIHSNAYVRGFFSDDTYSAVYKGDKTEAFTNLKNGEELDGKRSFYRIQMSAKEGAGWNYLISKNPRDYSSTVLHETGHYLFGFWDEYLNADGDEWRKVGGKPYSQYGLMDNQHIDIEMSKASSDYSYMSGNFAGTSKDKHTYQSWNHKESCEDSLERLLTSGTYTHLGSTNSFAGFSTGKYRITYTKAPKGKDRTAKYSYAGLESGDYMSTTAHSASASSDTVPRALSITEGLSGAADATYFDSFTRTVTSLGNVSIKGTDSTASFTISPLDGYSYSLYTRKPGESSFTNIKLTDAGKTYTATLPIGTNAIAEMRVVATKDGKTSYNSYYIDRSNKTDKGFMYTSVDNKVMAYVMADENSSYTFVADNTTYTNGEYFSVNQATAITSDAGITIDSGEIYSVASFMAEIDLKSISWFKLKDGTWTKLATDYAEEENMNIGARADIAGEGTYVLMAKKLPASPAIAPENVSYKSATDRDAVVTISFSDKNTGSKYYNVYYSDKEFTDKNAENVIVNSFSADSTNLVMDLYERGRTVYAAVEIILEDGRRSPLSKLIKIVAGAADSDGDGIPDWYCDEYRIWGDGITDKDIAKSDDDIDTLPNLEEFKRGSDPTNPNDPFHTTNIAVTGLNVTTKKITLAPGATESVSATVIPENATNKNVDWTVKDEAVATIKIEGNVCKITGKKEGTTQIYAVTSDGGYSVTIDVEVKKEAHVHNNKDGALEKDKTHHWKVCDDCKAEYDKEVHKEGAWITDKKAEVGKAGERHKECTVCGYVTVKEAIPELTPEEEPKEEEPKEEEPKPEEPPKKPFTGNYITSSSSSGGGGYEASSHSGIEGWQIALVCILILILVGFIVIVIILLKRR